MGTAAGVSSVAGTRAAVSGGHATEFRRRAADIRVNYNFLAVDEPAEDAARGVRPDPRPCVAELRLDRPVGLAARSAPGPPLAAVRGSAARRVGALVPPAP